MFLVIDVNRNLIMWLSRTIAVQCSGVERVTLLWLCALHYALGASLPASSSSDSLAHQLTYNVETSDKTKIQHVSNIITALEDLGILAGNKRQCYTVDRITKTQEKHVERSWKVGIHLYVQEMSNEKSRPVDEGVTLDGGGSRDPTYSNTNVQGGNGGAGHGSECLLTPSKSGDSTQDPLTNEPQIVFNGGVAKGDNLTSGGGSYSEEGDKSNQTAGAVQTRGGDKEGGW